METCGNVWCDGPFARREESFRGALADMRGGRAAGREAVPRPGGAAARGASREGLDYDGRHDHDYVPRRGGGPVRHLLYHERQSYDTYN
eukprot:6751359-Pyramimonas_sp.AAC.1